MKATDKDLLEVARDSGRPILLDGRIGRQEYTSVSGPAEALQRFAHALRHEPQGAIRVRPARMRERIASVTRGKTHAQRSLRRVSAPRPA